MPEALAERAALLEQPALALLDRDGLYGAPRFYRAATRVGINPLVGAEVTLAEGGRLPLLVESPEGYQNLCRLITKMRMRAAKPDGAASLEEVAAHAAGLTEVIVPERNAADLEDVPAEVRDKMTFHTVGSVGEVLALALEKPNASVAAAAA